MGDLVPLKVYSENLSDRSLSAQFNSRRADKELKFAVEKQFALERIRDNKKLQECRPETVRGAMLDQAVTGLSLSPVLQHAYLIPWGDVCTFSPSYRGLTHLAVKAGTLKSIQAAVVYENDQFDTYYDESGPRLIHKPARKNRGKETDVWSLARFTNGDKHLEVMTWEEVMKCKAAAERLHKGKTPPAWVAWPHEMAKKCCVRRGFKFWPLDEGGQLEAAMKAMDRAEPMDWGTVEREEPQDQELVMSESEVEGLEAFCRDLGIKDPGKWLSGLSEALGYQSIEQVPSAKYEECKQRIQRRYDALQESGP